jgi:hypothetical protein
MKQYIQFPVPRKERRKRGREKGKEMKEGRKKGRKEGREGGREGEASWSLYPSPKFFGAED